MFCLHDVNDTISELLRRQPDLTKHLIFDHSSKTYQATSEGLRILRSHAGELGDNDAMRDQIFETFKQYVRQS